MAEPECKQEAHATDDLQQAMYHLQRFLRWHNINGDYARVTVELPTEHLRYAAQENASLEVINNPTLRFSPSLTRFRWFGLDLKFTSTEERTRW